MPLYMKLTFMCGHYVCQFMSKVDQKQNWVKLKSVRTLLRIACLADWMSLYVTINVKSENVYIKLVGSNNAY